MVWLWWWWWVLDGMEMFELNGGVGIVFICYVEGIMKFDGENYFIVVVIFY